MKYEWLFREQIDDALQLVDHVNAYRADYNHVRPHEAIAWNRPADVHLGLADPTTPTFEIEKTLPNTGRGTPSSTQFATAGRIDWYNTRRLHSGLGYVLPAEAEQAHQTALAREPQTA